MESAICTEKQGKLTLYRYLVSVYRVLGARFLKISMNFAGKRLRFLLPVAYADRALYNAEHVLVDCDYFQIQEAIPRPGSVVLDIGGFLGFYAVASSKLASPSGAVHVLEPNAELLPVLYENLHLNDAGRMRVYPVAVCPERGYAKLYVGEYPAVSSVVRDHVERYTGVKCVLEVKCVELGSLLRHLGSIDVLKLDIEGLETAVLKKALGELGKTRVLVVEVHTDTAKPAEVELILEKGGFTKLVAYTSSEMENQVIVYGVK